MACKLEQVIKTYYKSDPLSRGELKNTVAKAYKNKGFTDEEITKITNMIEERFNIRFKKESQQYLNRLMKSDPSMRKPDLEKIMKLIESGAYDNNSIKNIIKERYGLPVLTGAESKKIMSEMDRIAKLNPESDAYQIGLARVKSIIESKTPVKGTDVINSIVNTALLGNIKTQVANVSGNAVEAALEITGNATVSPWVDKIINAVAKKYIPNHQGMRTASLPSVKTLLQGFGKGASTTISDSLGGLQMSELKGLSSTDKVKKIMGAIWEVEPIKRNLTGITDDKFNLTRRLNIPKEVTWNGKKIPIVSEISRFGRILENTVRTVAGLGDNTFSKPYYDDVLNQIKKANKINTITDEMKNVARGVAQERTYSDYNILSMAAEGFRNLPSLAMQRLGSRAPESMRPLLNKVTDAAQVYFNSLGRFGFTTANLVKRGMEYSPLGVVEGLAKLGYGIKTGTLNMQQQRHIVDLITRGILGTTVVAPASVYAFKNKIFNLKEKEDYQVERLKQETQMLPYSVKIGDKNVTIDWLQPLSYSMIAAGEFSKGSKEDKTWYDSMVSGLENTFNVYGEQPAAQSMKRLFGKEYSADESFGERAVASSLEPIKQLVPTVSGQTAVYNDENKRELYSPKFFEKNLVNPVKNKIPFLRETLPEKVGLLGKTQKEYYGDNDFINSYVARWRTGDFKPNEVEKEILELYDKTKNVEVIPAYSVKQVTYTDKNGNEQKFILTGQERSDYQRNLGTYAEKYIGELIKLKGYKNLKKDLNYNDAANEITKVIANSREYAKEMFLNSKGVEQKSKKKTFDTVKTPTLKRGKNGGSGKY
jgi:hypothetical protein